MASPQRIRVYIACSLDGYIAGPNDDLSWLPQGPQAEEPPPRLQAGPQKPLTYDDFTKDIGVILMGRRTFDVVRGFDMPWPYAAQKVLVATHRDLNFEHPGVRRAQGDIQSLIEAAKIWAEGKDIYLDGGNLIAQALRADLIDEFTLTIVPVILGAGAPLFSDITQRKKLEFTHHAAMGSMIQLQAVPNQTTAKASEES